MNKKISKLTPEQEALIPKYFEKWKPFIFSCEPIDREESIATLKAIYKLMGYNEPQILIFDSPYAALQHMIQQENFFEIAGRDIWMKFHKRIWNHIFSGLQNQLCSLELKIAHKILNLYRQSVPLSNYLIEEELRDRVYNEFHLTEQRSIELNNNINSLTIISHLVSSYCQADFCISVLKCNVDRQKWNLSKLLLKHCGSFFLYEKICSICDRPRLISLDSQNRFHAEGTPAIQFNDGFSIYAYRNVRLPANYGRFHPSQWQAKWLLEGHDADITKVLVEGIGYPRIRQEIQSIELNALDKYELLRTNLDIKIESTYPQALSSFEFQVITVNSKGEIVKTEQKQAKFFVKNLGNGITLEMVAILGGEFMMGTPNYYEEKPQYLVKIAPFFLSKYPITQAQWRAVAMLPKVKEDLDPDPSNFKGDTRPVERISGEEAIEFCARLWRKTGRDYRLPSEAQWEYACRAGTTTPFYFGETITTQLANYDGNYIYAEESQGIYRGETTPVGSFPPNAFGLYDMHGNVFERCADNWHEDYRGAPEDGSARIGGTDCYSSVRGGGWTSEPQLCRSANRNDEFRRRDMAYKDVGLRLACF